MAITKETILTQVECVKMDTWKVLQVKTQIRVLEDGTEIANSNHRTTIYPNVTSASLAEQPADVQAIANAIWSTSHITSYNNHLSSSIASGSI
tara:strand:- start:1395 stop:1673 length:279 start_codon:yes stop_codon:yes gene_type:complete